MTGVRTRSSTVCRVPAKDVSFCMWERRAWGEHGGGRGGFLCSFGGAGGAERGPGRRGRGGDGDDGGGDGHGGGEMMEVGLWMEMGMEEVMEVKGMEITEMRWW